MKKTDKKRDNQLRILLTQLCDTAVDEIAGFQWLTHLVNYSRFPQSLKIVVVFDNQTNLARFSDQSRVQQCNKLQFIQQLKAKLASADIQFSDINQHVIFDTETACEQQHQGNWAARLQRH
ncbi:Fis family transcriptional regulator [Shewanella intestini]|uniref:Fis family transcriptional regulator n=2 Tax=Shewanellaceae TaxID=267890 RepID=A0ABS5I541_9GAMM|nr:Fis family transcriptional regulator [Shewanella intestini]MRG37287.1 Fis family transcriptional regulator [Shewanella sp. XMDDZSB0408]